MINRAEGIKILIVDDDDDKSALIIDSLLKLGIPRQGVTLCRDGVGAFSHCQAEAFDLIILDILLPWAEGEEPSDRAVDVLLNRLSRSDSVKLPRYGLGLTVDSSLRNEFVSKFGRVGWSVSTFDNTGDWINVISALVSSLNTKATSPTTDYAILCALVDPELEAVLRRDCGWTVSDRALGNGGTFYIGEIEDFRGRTSSVVATSCRHMGPVGAATSATRLIEFFKPRVLAVPGITAGIKASCNFGDIIIGTSSWDYNSGKIVKIEGRKRVFLPSPNEIAIPAGTESAIRRFLQGVDEESWIRNQAFVFGPVASGAQVVADDSVTADVLARNRKTKGIEMEVYAAFYSARHSSHRVSSFFSCKSVTDFADEGKDDAYRLEACERSAKFLFSLIKSGELLDRE